jgi:hypothetical protein
MMDSLEVPPKRSPQLDVSWYVFNNEHTGLTQTEVLPPDCGDCG